MRKIVLIICALTFVSCVEKKVVEMSTINQLSAVSAVTASQQVPVYDPDNGDARKASVTQLQTYMQDNLDIRPDDRFVTQVETAGLVTYNITLTGSDNILLLLTTLTAGAVFSWFADGNVVDGQEIIICTANDCILSKPSGITFFGWPDPSSLDEGGSLHFKYNAQTLTWWRIG
jgi:hypothetical protein